MRPTPPPCPPAASGTLECVSGWKSPATRRRRLVSFRRFSDSCFLASANRLCDNGSASANLRRPAYHAGVLTPGTLPESSRTPTGVAHRSTPTAGNHAGTHRFGKVHRIMTTSTIDQYVGTAPIAPNSVLQPSDIGLGDDLPRAGGPDHVRQEAFPVPPEAFDAQTSNVKLLATPIGKVRGSMVTLAGAERAAEGDPALANQPVGPAAFSTAAGRALVAAQIKRDATLTTAYSAAVAALAAIQPAIDLAVAKSAQLKAELVQMAIRPPADQEGRDRLREIRALGAERLAQALVNADVETLQAVLQAPAAMGLIGSDAVREGLIDTLAELLAPKQVEELETFNLCLTVLVANHGIATRYATAGLARCRIDQ